MFSPTDKAPGVYVQEVPSSVHPITGASTSIPGFLGLVSGPVDFPVSNQTIAGTTNSNTFTFMIDGIVDVNKPYSFSIDGKPVTVDKKDIKPNNPAGKTTATATVKTDVKSITGSYQLSRKVTSNAPVLCTSFAQFEKNFSSFSTTSPYNYLVHAVYGFFNNGGASCYVMVSNSNDASTAIQVFDPYDDVSLLAIPTNPGDKTAAEALLSDSENLKNRFAILDAAKGQEPTQVTLPTHSEYGAYYYPWIQVFDPPTKTLDPKGNGLILVPPSGHVAGCYARTDNDRGVWKAPANVVVSGALDVGKRVTNNEQGLLNTAGVDVIRNFSGDVTIWGARTMADLSTDSEWKYVNVRRFFIYLEQSIKQSTRWVVFEPNEPSLWAKITRNVTAFLTNLWRAGAMAGSTPKEAFFVQCDAATNPPEVQEQGMVVTRIGVAPAYPAEFVVFEISQGVGPS